MCTYTTSTELIKRKLPFFPSLLLNSRGKGRTLYPIVFSKKDILVVIESATTVSFTGSCTQNRHVESNYQTHRCITCRLYCTRSLAISAPECPRLPRFYFPFHLAFKVMTVSVLVGGDISMYLYTIRREYYNQLQFWGQPQCKVSRIGLNLYLSPFCRR